jgi:hypothetical protein
MNTTTRIAAVALVTTALAAPTLPAFAKDGDVIKRGSCSGATDWKLKASPEDGRIEVEAEVDSNRNGQTWSWRLNHNGSVSARGTATTKAPSGSFEVRRVVVNLAGADRMVFRAQNTRSGEVCRGVVTF